jgi:hypothetical protein
MLQNAPTSAYIGRAHQKEEEYAIGWSLNNLFWNLKVWARVHLIIVKWSVVWLGSETELEQVADELKWLSGNGKNGRIYIKDEF